MQQALPTNLALDHLVNQETVHNQTVDKEKVRKQQVADEEAKQFAIKMEEKRLRKEAREAKSPAAKPRARLEGN